jgi:hypothetical protein
MSQHAYDLGSADNITVMILLLLRTEAPPGISRDIMDRSSFDSLKFSKNSDKYAASKFDHSKPFRDPNFGLEKMDSNAQELLDGRIIAKRNERDDGISLTP